MVVKRVRKRVGAEVEEFFEKPHGEDLKVKPFKKGTFSVDVEGHRIWLVPEIAEQGDADIAEGLPPLANDPNELDASLAYAHTAIKGFAKSSYGKDTYVIPFRHGTESENTKVPRTVVGGHIQYQSPSWRGPEGRINLDEVIKDSQKIRAFALPFIGVDAGVERACRKDSPCRPSSRLFLRHKTRLELPEADNWTKNELPTANDVEITLSAERFNVPGRDELIRELSLEVRNPPAGPAMGKHALDILVAASQEQAEGGFNVPLKQKSDVWGVLEGKSSSTDLDIHGHIFLFQSHGIRSIPALREHLGKIPDEVMGPQAREIKDIVNSLDDSELKTEESNAATFEEYIETSKSAARLRYRALVNFAGKSTLMRDAYAQHYLNNRKMYDGADPAVHEWVRAATDNGFSYTDFRIALRRFFTDKDKFNMLVDDVMGDAFTLDENSKRPTLASVLTGQSARYLDANDSQSLKGLGVFLSHRHSDSVAEGEIPDGLKTRDRDGSVIVSVPAQDTENIGKLLDAGFMFYNVRKLPDGRGYFELEYNKSVSRDKKIREALAK